jgi:4-amino-4-deoxy-L-arabinose transferase-like glycosyltransferase
MLFSHFLTFSDAAKFADIARTFLQTGIYGQSFTFWDPYPVFPVNSEGVQPLMPFSIALAFRLFGLSDLSVKLVSFFFFILTLVFIFLLAKKIFKSNLIACLSIGAIGFNFDLLDYALKGASESPLVFEMVAAAYFLTLKKRAATFIGFFIMVLMYFTRPQAFIYIAGLTLFYLLLKFPLKRAFVYFLLISVAAILIDRFLIVRISGKFFLYSVFFRGLSELRQEAPQIAISDSLRGVALPVAQASTIFKKIFYNLYNFYKLMPQIMNPYLFILFVIGLVKWEKDKIKNSFKAASLFMIIATLAVTAASIPFFRYIHPIVPLVYIIAVGTLVEIINYQVSIYNKLSIFNSQFTRRLLLIFISSFLILLFAVGQTLGVIFLDSRFEANTHNVEKPPVYVKLSYILRDNTTPNQVVVTNLDTWGSWYGERKTVWFPVEPKMLVDASTGKVPFDAIYLTSYLVDDQNYYMGNNWREIFNNPIDPKNWVCDGCAEIAKQFRLKGVYQIQASEDYERESATSILLIKK